MAKQKTCQKFVYKLHTSRLIKAKWKLDLPLSEARKNKNDIISLSDSQVLRFIDIINGTTDSDQKAKQIKSTIKMIKKQSNSPTVKKEISKLYDQLYELQFQPDYMCLIIDKKSDYDRAVKGFEINGIKYRRFLGTNGGVKNSTIVFVSERVYPILKEKMDNGRNKEIPLVPAKLEAYQALICSGSIPVSMPKGIIVVPDCVTTFTEDVINIDDSNDGEPELTFIKDKEITLTESDGYGFMLPSLSERWNVELGGEPGETLSGVNTRGLPWTKGMLFCFDFIEFGEKIAHNYMIKDAWGDWRDVRDAEVILTTSMLKLWDCYKDWEDYWENTTKNGFQFAVSKTSPHKLENERSTNYQFLQSFQLTDEELDALIKPTIDEIKDVQGLDYRKSLLFLKGMELNERNFYSSGDYDFTKALMIDQRMINDPFVRSRINYMIKKKIRKAKIGVIKVKGNFAIIGGDPYSLAQSMFGLPVTGLLKAGETYHKYWSDQGVQDIACFRAPMTCHNNIRRMRAVATEEMKHWYQYIETCMLINSWDCTADALNGADKDGDLFFTTNNEILVRNVRGLPAITCVQRKAQKKIVTEDDLIAANKLGFGDEIGATTNTITSQIEVQAGFEPDSEEYKILDYRIMCGQLLQQNTIDKIKGIVSKPMPKEWCEVKANQILQTDSEEIKKIKLINQKIVAHRYPYFFVYNYPSLMKQYKNYMKSCSKKCRITFKTELDTLLKKENRTESEESFVEFFNRLNPIGNNPCLVNRLCWKFEDAFSSDPVDKEVPFDYTFLKNDAAYTPSEYNAVSNLYNEYLSKVNDFMAHSKQTRVDDRDNHSRRSVLLRDFKIECEKVCPNEDALCNIVLDLCYTKNSSKQFAWDVCGETIIHHLLKLNNNQVSYPTADVNGDILYCGNRFSMVTATISESEDDFY